MTLEKLGGTFLKDVTKGHGTYNFNIRGKEVTNKSTVTKTNIKKGSEKHKAIIKSKQKPAVSRSTTNISKLLAPVGSSSNPIKSKQPDMSKVAPWLKPDVEIQPKTVQANLIPQRIPDAVLKQPPQGSVQSLTGTQTEQDLIDRIRLEQQNARLANEQQRQKVNTILGMNFGQKALGFGKNATPEQIAFGNEVAQKGVRGIITERVGDVRNPTFTFGRTQFSSDFDSGIEDRRSTRGLLDEQGGLEIIQSRLNSGSNIQQEISARRTDLGFTPTISQNQLDNAQRIVQNIPAGKVAIVRSNNKIAFVTPNTAERLKERGQSFGVLSQRQLNIINNSEDGFFPVARADGSVSLTKTAESADALASRIGGRISQSTGQTISDQNTEGQNFQNIFPFPLSATEPTQNIPTNQNSITDSSGLIGGSIGIGGRLDGVELDNITRTITSNQLFTPTIDTTPYAGDLPQPLPLTDSQLVTGSFGAGILKPYAEFSRGVFIEGRNQFFDLVNLNQQIGKIFVDTISPPKINPKTGVQIRDFSREPIQIQTTQTAPREIITGLAFAGATQITGEGRESTNYPAGDPRAELEIAGQRATALTEQNPWLNLGASSFIVAEAVAPEALIAKGTGSILPNVGRFGGAIGGVFDQLGTRITSGSGIFGTIGRQLTNIFGRTTGEPTLTIMRDGKPDEVVKQSIKSNLYPTPDNQKQNIIRDGFQQSTTSITGQPKSTRTNVDDLNSIKFSSGVDETINPQQTGSRSFQSENFQVGQSSKDIPSKIFGDDLKTGTTGIGKPPLRSGGVVSEGIESGELTKFNIAFPLNNVGRNPPISASNTRFGNQALPKGTTRNVIDKIVGAGAKTDTGIQETASRGQKIIQKTNSKQTTPKLKSPSLKLIGTSVGVAGGSALLLQPNIQQGITEIISSNQIFNNQNDEQTITPPIVETMPELNTDVVTGQTTQQALDNPFPQPTGQTQTPAQGTPQIPRLGLLEFVPNATPTIPNFKFPFRSGGGGGGQAGDQQNDFQFFRVFSVANQPFGRTTIPLGGFVDSSAPIREVTDVLSREEIFRENRITRNPLRAPQNIVDEDSFIDDLLGFNANGNGRPRSKRKSRSKSPFNENLFKL